MDITKFFKSFSPIELSLLVVFIIYIVMPIDTPTFLSGLIDSPVGMVTIFAITLYLFFYANPILAIVYIFVAYELLRRSTTKINNVAMVQFTPRQKEKDAEMIAMNKPSSDVLEIDIISKMAPVGESKINEPISSSFSPILENVGEASAY